jgi:hypothetical protein
MAISVVNPVSTAIERTRRILFEPFDAGKWFVLGFCAFLAHLGEGGFGPPGNGGDNSSGGGGGGGGPNDVREVNAWLQDHLALILVLVALTLLVTLAIVVVLLWLNSRGRFLFIDGIVRNRAAVVKPWKKYRREGNALFGFRLVFGLLTGVVLLLIVSLCLIVAWPDISARNFRAPAALALLVGVALLLPTLLATWLVNLFLLDFVVPVMYVRRLGVLAAWGVFFRELLAGRVGTFLLYVLFKVLLALVVGLLAGTVTCLTCCMAAIPYLGSVVLLPLLVFTQAYPLCFLEQFGPSWRLFSRRRRPFIEDEEGYAGEGEWEDRGPPDDRFRPPEDRFRPAE